MIEYSLEPVESPRFGVLLRPAIPVRIIGPTKTATVAMLIDSGADLTMIPRSAGEAIGLSMNGKQRGTVAGVGSGSVPYSLCNISIGIGPWEFPVRVAWVRTERVPLLLGRLDVFNQLCIEFREFDNRVILKHKDEAAM